jgi:hypothetical protein
MCDELNHRGNKVAKEQSVVEVIDLDKEISAQAIEILGDGEIVWDLSRNPPILQYLSLHLRNLDKFLSFEVVVVDESSKTRVFKISNRRSHAVISNEKIATDKEEGETEISVCELPLSIGSGWQMCCVDLVDLCQSAFGTRRPNVLSISLKGNCRVSKVFFHKEKYADAEMPPHLRCVGN